MSSSLSDSHTLDVDGFVLLQGAVSTSLLIDLQKRCALILEKDCKRPGVRNLLGEDEYLTEVSRNSPIMGRVRDILGEGAFPVRIILFNKTSETNWGVPWHQDLNIAVMGKENPDGYTSRTIKQGIPHIVPPARVLKSMMTARLHLDDCTADNGALVVAPGTHHGGIIKQSSVDIDVLNRKCYNCEANAGDLLLMRPLLFHRSEKSLVDAPRRVLHIEYASCDLDGDLDWYFASSGKKEGC